MDMDFIDGGHEGGGLITTILSDDFIDGGHGGGGEWSNNDDTIRR